MLEREGWSLMSTSRPGWALGAQLNLYMVIAIVTPAVAVLALGAFLISNQGGSLTQTVLWAITLIVTAVALLIISGVLLRMRIVTRTRLLELAEVCRQVSSGARSMRAQVVGDDELATLASGINALLDGLPVSPTATRANAADSPDAALLQAQIERLLQEVSAVGDGDLRVQAEVTPDTLGVLADSFNYMIEELAKVVGRVQATTFQVTNATRRLLDRSAEIASASETQAVQISQTSQAVGQLADFVQLSAQNAVAAAEVARDAIRSAQMGAESVTQTINGMVHIRDNVQDTAKKIKRLGERSKEVGEITSLIEDIAEQTNLLALNAAIQSAMAGEHGRGFAVVADEIRVLAERVAKATQEVTTLVQGIQGDTYEAVVAMEESTTEVVNGSRLADAAGQALKSINEAVEQQAKIIDDIARVAGEREQVAEAVAQAMVQIAEVTRQTNSATQDTTRSVSYLAELAEQLRASVATFRLPDQIAEQAGLNQLAQMEEEYRAGMNMPAIGNWGDGMGQLPALPAASAQAMNQSMGMGAAGPYHGYEGGFESGYAEGFNGGYDTGGYADPRSASVGAGGYASGYPMDGAGVGAFDPLAPLNNNGAQPDAAFDFGGYNSPWVNPSLNPQNIPNQPGQIPGYPEQSLYGSDQANTGSNGNNGNLMNPNGTPF